MCSMFMHIIPYNNNSYKNAVLMLQVCDAIFHQFSDMGGRETERERE